MKVCIGKRWRRSSLSQRAAVCFLVTAVMLSVGCGVKSGASLSGGQKETTSGLVGGNWSFALTSQVIHGDANFMNGALTSSGTTVPPQTLAQGDPCLPASAYGITDGYNTFSGSLDGNNIVLSSSNAGRTLTITGTVSNGTNIDATYALTGGTGRCAGDEGTVAGSYVPAITGAWNVSGSNYVNDGSGEKTYCGGNVNTTDPVCLADPDVVDVTASLIQAATANSTGGTPISGTLTLSSSNLTCYGSSGVATIDNTQSYVQGSEFRIYATAGSSSISLFGYLPSPATALQIGDSGSPLSLYTSDCPDYLGGVIASKQQ